MTDSKKKLKVGEKPKVSEVSHQHEKKEYVGEKDVCEIGGKANYCKWFSKNKWYVISGVLSLLVVILLIMVIYYAAGGNSGGSAGNESSAVLSAGVVELLIVEDPACKSCQVDLAAAQMESNLEGNDLVSDLVVRKVSIESAEGKKIVEGLRVVTVPLFLFSENIAEMSGWEQNMAPAFDKVSVSGDGYYSLKSQYIVNKALVDDVEITDSAVVIGNEDAKVTVIEFSDYECPFCALAEGNEEMLERFRAQSPDYEAPMPKVFEEYIDTGKVRFVFYNLPLESLHPLVKSAHLAALCANEQEMWREYHEKLFADKSWSETNDRESVLVSFAADLGLDESKFSECLSSKKYENQIDEEAVIAGKYGISGTPAFFVNRVFLSGAQDYKTFKSAIDQELAKE